MLPCATNASGLESPRTRRRRSDLPRPGRTFNAHLSSGATMGQCRAFEVFASCELVRFAHPESWERRAPFCLNSRKRHSIAATIDTIQAREPLLKTDALGRRTRVKPNNHSTVGLLQKTEAKDLLNDCELAGIGSALQAFPSLQSGHRHIHISSQFSG
jgi:hypothetical protein